MSKERFYIKDDKVFNIRENKELVLKDQLYFAMRIPSLGSDGKMDPNDFDGRATREHVKGYPRAFGDFSKANPGFILPWDRVDGGPTFNAVKKEKEDHVSAKIVPAHK